MYDRRRLFEYVAEDAFKLPNPRVLTAQEYVSEPIDCVVALGRGSGSEIQITNADDTKMSFDWVLAWVQNSEVRSIAALEVQSVDVTGNYRAALNAHMAGTPSPGSKHGYNQANVYKRLISQLIPKGKAISNSHLATGGLYFALPDKFVPYFYQKLGGILKPMPVGADTLSVFGVGVDLSSYSPGRVMDLTFTSPIRAQIDSVAAMTMRGVGSQGPAIDQAVRRRLGM